MNTINKIFYGSDLKFLLNIDFVDIEDKDAVDFTIEFINNDHSISFRKEELIKITPTQFLICIKHTRLNTGNISAKITASIPDVNFADEKKRSYKDK